MVLGQGKAEYLAGTENQDQVGPSLSARHVAGSATWALVDERAVDGLLHITDMSWTRKISHPNEVVRRDSKSNQDSINVDQSRRRGTGAQTVERVGNGHPSRTRSGRSVGRSVTEVGTQASGSKIGRPVAHLGVGRP